MHGPSLAAARRFGRAPRGRHETPPRRRVAGSHCRRPRRRRGFVLRSRSKPCFIAGNTGYRISDSSSADFTVRIDNAAAKPDLRMQLVDDSAAADFVLVDDATAVNSCAGVAAVKSVRLDAKAQKPDLTVTLSRAPADYKIYVRSAEFSQAGRRRAVRGDLAERAQRRPPARFRPRIRRPRLKSPRRLPPA